MTQAKRKILMKANIAESLIEKPVYASFDEYLKHEYSWRYEAEQQKCEEDNEYYLRRDEDFSEFNLNAKCYNELITEMLGFLANC